MRESSIQIFSTLLSAGLWEKEAYLAKYGEVDYSEVFELASEQSVTGLISAGLEHVVDVKIPKEIIFAFIGDTLQIEQRNKTMNDFVAVLITKLRINGVYAILVKGQGVAQCYERPLWRACGDVDLFLSDENYLKAADLLNPLSTKINEERAREKHLAMMIDGWEVELHGRLYGGLSQRVEKELDRVYEEAFFDGIVRSWMNSGTQVFMLSIENDVFYVFTHILQHFYKEGVGLRQICDWCRLLWSFKDKLDLKLLESRIRRSGLLSEWCVFGAYAVEYLGMPEEAMPMLGSRFTVHDVRLIRKAKRINEFILNAGNMGHNRDMSHFQKYPFFIRKCVSAGRRIRDLINHARIFPLDSLRFSLTIMKNGLKSAVRGEG